MVMSVGQRVGLRGFVLAQQFAVIGQRILRAPVEIAAEAAKIAPSMTNMMMTMAKMPQLAALPILLPALSS